MGRVKNSLLTLGIVAIAALTSFSAKASLLIEPHFGYNLHGSADVDVVTIKYNGTQYGARLGVQSFGFMGGLDYTHSTFTSKASVPTFGDFEADQKRDQLGVFVGYKFPILVRAWVGYYFSDKTTQTNDGTFGAKGDWMKGNGTEIGVGFTGLPFLSINLQYRMSTYDKADDGAMDPKFKTKEIVLGISAPFTLL